MGDSIKELLNKSINISENIDDILNKENELIKTYVHKDKIIKYCNDNIDKYNKRIDNLYSAKKKNSPLIERYRGQVRAYEDIKKLLEG